MDNNSDNFRNKQNEHLGVNKIGKNIKKTQFGDPSKSLSQPQVYNINKNEFRNIVQQLTGSPSHHSQQPILPLPLPLVRPPHKSRSMRLQRIRPPPLAPINVTQPLMPVQGQQVQRATNTGWSNTTESHSQSPISAYMCYLQNSINDMGNPRSQSDGLLPNPHVPPPRTSGMPPLLASPNSQFLIPSPSSYLNLSSPRSPYAFSPGILGPGPLPLLSPGLSFPLSPGFFSVLSPRWRD